MIARAISLFFFLFFSLLPSRCGSLSPRRSIGRQALGGVLPLRRPEKQLGRVCDGGGDVLSILASSLRPEGTSVSSSGLDMSVQSWSLSVSGRGKAPGADQARRLTSSTEAD